MGTTKIPYAPGLTVGGIHGCTPIPGPDGAKESGPCAHCWAEAMARRFGWPWGPPEIDPAETVAHRIRTMPAPRNGRRLTFPWPMGDPLHESIPIGWLATQVRAMNGRQDRAWLLLTKRPGRYSDLVWCLWSQGIPWPRNVWLGVSAWDHGTAYQAWAAVHRATRWQPGVPVLPGVRWWLSLEPLLGPIRDLDGFTPDFVVVGCESGPGARPCPQEWVEDIVCQCRDAEIPVWVKQWRENPDGTGRIVHRPEVLGRVWEEVPRE